MCGGLERLCFSNEPNDAVQRAIPRGPRCLHFQSALAVDGAGEDVRSRHFVHGHRLTRDGRLVHGAVADADLPIHGDTISGVDDDDLTYHNLDNRYLALLSVAQHAGHRRGEVRQRRDGIARPSEAVVL